MLKKFVQIFEVIVKQLAIAFFFACFLIVVVNLLWKDQIDLYISLVNKILISQKKDNNSITQEISIDPIKKKLVHYPKWKEIWATLKIPDIGVEASVYQGDTLDIIQYGIGHYAGSYYPGEGASVILAAHNSKEHFMYLPQLEIGAKIIVEAVYGTYTYEVTSTKIIKDNDTASLPIQKEEELLMMYTCYPVATIGHKDKRYVVYAKLVGESYE